MHRGEAPAAVGVAGGVERHRARSTHRRAGPDPPVPGGRPVPQVDQARRVAGRGERTTHTRQVHVHHPGGRPGRGGDGRHGPAHRVPPPGCKPRQRGAHRASRARSPPPRCWPPSAPEGPTLFWWPTADGTVHAYGSNGKDLPGWPVHTAPDTGYHPGEEAYTSSAVRTTPRGEIVGGLAVGDLADASGRDLDVVATDLTGRVWAWNAEGKLLRGLAGADRRGVLGTGRDQHRTTRCCAGSWVRRCSGICRATGPSTWSPRRWTATCTPGSPAAEAAPGWPVEVVDPSEVQSVDPSNGQVTFLPGAGGDTGTKLVDTPAIAQLVPGGPPEVVVTSNEQYTGTPNASLGTLGVLFSAFGKLSGAANSRVYAIWPDGSSAPSRARAHRIRPAIRTLVPSSPAGRWPSPTSIPTCSPTSATGPATARRWPRCPAARP